MTVMLASLRIAPEIDASKYVAGAQQKAAADRAMTESSMGVAQALSATNTRIGDASNVVSVLARRYVEGERAVQTFERDLAKLSRQLESGKATTQEAASILVGMNQRLGMTADATKIAAQGQTLLAEAVEAANAQIQGQSTALLRAAEAHRAMVAGAREAQLAENQRQVALANQGRFNQLLGVGRPAASAASSASVFQAQFDRFDALERQLDPGITALHEMARAERVLTQAQAQGMITAARKNELLLLAQQRHIGAASAARTNAASLSLVSQGLSNAATQAALFHGPLGGVASRFTALSSLLAGGIGLMSGFTLAAAGLGVALGKAAMEQEQFNRSSRRMEAVLNATGQAVGLTLEDIREFGRELSGSTLATGSDVEAAAAKLLTFSRISGDLFKDTMKAAQDLAAVGYGTIAANVEQLGRALENPIEGLDSLSRSGFRFSQSQREMIRSLVETGRAAEASRLILSEVESVVSGTGGREADGLSGAFHRLRGNVGDFWVALGDRTNAAPAFTSIIDRISASLGRLSGALSPENFGDRNQAIIDTMRLIVDLEGRRQRLLSGAAGSGANVQDAVETIDDEISRLRGEVARMEREDSERWARRIEAEQTAVQVQTETEQERIAAAVEKRRRELERTLAFARLDLELVGATVSETERRRMEETLIAEIRRRAGEEGVAVAEEEIALIREQSAEFGRLRAIISARTSIDSRRDEIELARAELELMGESDAARQRAISSIQVEQEIRRLGIELYGAEALAMRENAAALSALAEASSSARMRQDLQFERDQVFRSRQEQQIASRLRGTGMGADSPEARYMRETMQLQDLRDGVQGFFSDMRSGLMQGEDMGRALANAILNALSRQMDRAIDPLVNAVAASLAQAMGLGGAIPAQSASAASGAAGLAMQAAGSGLFANGAVAAPGSAVVGMEAYRQAIQAIESRGSGGYSAVGPTHPRYGRALGAYQVMETNVGPWSQAALGRRVSPDEFLGSRAIQDAVFDHRFGGYVDRYGASGAASMWFTGRPSAPNARDVLGTTGSVYVERFNAELARLGATAASANDNLTGFGSSLASTAREVTSALSGGGGVASAVARGIGRGGMFSPAAAGDTHAATMVGGGASGGAGMLGGLLSFIPRLFGFADGTEHAPGGWAWVGERGPELRKLRPGDVIRSNPASIEMAAAGKQAGSIGGITIGGATIIVQGNADERSLAEIKAFQEQRDRKMLQELRAEIAARENRQKRGRTA